MKYSDIVSIQLSEQRIDPSDVYDIKSKAQLIGLLKRFGVVRLMLLDDGFVGWDAADFTHGDYLDDFDNEGINLTVVLNHGTDIVIEYMPPNPKQDVRLKGTSPEYLLNNRYFKTVFGKVKVRFENADPEE